MQPFKIRCTVRLLHKDFQTLGSLCSLFFAIRNRHDNLSFFISHNCSHTKSVVLCAFPLTQTRFGTVKHTTNRTSKHERHFTASQPASSTHPVSCAPTPPATLSLWLLLVAPSKCCHFAAYRRTHICRRAHTLTRSPLRLLVFLSVTWDFHFA